MCFDFYVYIKYHQRMRNGKESSKRRPRGRPRKRVSEKRSEQVNVRITPDELHRIKSEAKRLGLSLSSVLMVPWRKET